jgi:hypothetical protein
MREGGQERPLKATRSHRSAGATLGIEEGSVPNNEKRSGYGSRQ